MSDFDVIGARKAGYSDKEIADYLAAQRGFDAEGARKAGYKDAEIVQHLSPVNPKESGMRAIKDAAGTGYDYLRTIGNTALAGVASIPRAVMEGVDWVGRQDAAAGGTGARVPETVKSALPTFQEAKDALNKPRMPYSALWDEKAFKDWQATKDTPRPDVTSGNPYVDAAVTGLVTAPFSGGTTWPMLAANVLGNVGSEVAGRIPGVEGTSAEPWARVGGAVLGAGAGVGAVRAGQKAVDVTKSIAAPFTEAGREQIVGRALRNASNNADDAVAAMERYAVGRDAFPDAVPGFQINAGQASRDPGLMATAEVAKAKTPAMAAQFQENNRLATNALEGAFAGTPSPVDAGSIVQRVLNDRFKSLVGERKAAADPLYTAARASDAVIDPTDAWAFAKGVAEEGKGKPAKMMGTVANYFETGAETPKQMMAARDAVTTLLDNPQLDNYRKSLLTTVKQKIDDALSVVPEEQAARVVFAEKSVPLEPFGKNTAAGSIVKRDQYNKAFVNPAEKATGDLSAKAVQNIMMASGGDPAVKTALQSAFFEDFKKAARSSVQEDAVGNKMLMPSGANKWLEANKGAAANVLTDDQMKALQDVARNLTDQAQTVPGRVNSATFDRLASESIVGALVNPKWADAAPLYPIRRALNIVYGGANEKAMDALFNAIQDPKVAAALMKKATPGNVKLAEPILQQIAQGSRAPITQAGRE